MKDLGDIIKADLPEGVTEMGAPAPSANGTEEPEQVVNTIESSSAPNLGAPPPVRPGDSVEGQKPVEPAPQTQEPEVPKYSLSEIFPNASIESLEQLREQFGEDNILERAKQAAELAQKNQELLEKANTNLKPWANDEIAELNEFTKATGKYDPTLFKVLKHSDIDSMDAVDVLVLEKQATNTDPTLTQQDIRRYVERKHGLTPRPYTGDPDDTEAKEAHERSENQRIQDAKIDLRIEAGEAKAKLQELKGHIKPVDLAAAQEAAINQQKEKIAEATKVWAPQIAEVSGKLRKFPVEYTGADGQPSTVEFDIPQEKLDVYKQQALEVVVSNNIPLDENGQQVVTSIMRSYAIVDYFPQMTAKAVNAAIAATTRKLDEEVSNPSGTKLPADPSGAAPASMPKTGDDLMDEAFKAQMGLMNQKGGGF